VEDDLYAFADGRTVKVFQDGEYYERNFDHDVTDLDIKESKIYCGCADDKAYTIPEKTECEYEFLQKRTRLEYNDYYYNSVGGKLYISNLLDPEASPTSYDGEYTDIKLYGGKVYAIKENSLYEFTGAECKDLGPELKYLDYSVADPDKISIGQARVALQTYPEIKFVEIQAGSFITAIGLTSEKLSGSHFLPPDDFNGNVTQKTDETMTALLLCYTDNAAIVSIGKTGYIVLKTKVSEIQVDFSKQSEFEKAQIIIGGNIYISPYTGGTIYSPNATGENVTVINKLVYEDVLETVFYEVEYTSGEKTVRGYVAEGFLSPTIIFGDNVKPNEIPDPNYSDSSDTKTILIILAVVLLVLAAIGYISHVSAKGKKKGKKKSKDKENEE
ncbi:MAG: hypothetical protein K2N23_06195, partial [Clostridia bacterium]|nr:hypothetical protein [Clostridia bacterium]